MQKIKIFNTLTRKIEEFKPIEEGKIKLYSCGPTVYDYAHIGNLRYFVFVDLLKRVFRKAGYDLYQVMNITDIDDKTIKRANERGVDFREISRKFEKIFFEDLQKLNCGMPDKTPRATDEVKLMGEMVSYLLREGYAYESEGSIYFKLSAYPDYGKLSGLDMDELKSGARVDVDSYEKESPGDFALWKGPREGEPSFETVLGHGRPGWHLECSALSKKYLGDHFDMHTGGVDLIFPHHENEMAQSEAFCGGKTVNYWVHSEHLLVEGRKMSKSTGNFYTLRELEEKGFSYGAIRYLLISTHYKTQLNFTMNGLEAAESTINRVKVFLQHVFESNDGEENVVEMLEKEKDNFFSALYNNLDIGVALAHMFTMINNVNHIGIDKLDQSSKDFLLAAFEEFNAILDIPQFKVEKGSVPAKVIELAKERDKMRAEKNFSAADELRDQIKAAGYIVEDSPDGFLLRKTES